MYAIELLFMSKKTQKKSKIVEKTFKKVKKDVDRAVNV